MHLLLEQYTENVKWYRAPRGSVLGTVPKFGAFRNDQAQSVADTLAADSVVVLFLFPEPTNNDAVSIETIINKCREFDNALKVWCHYGGDINFQELSDRWADYDRLPAVGIADPKQSLKDFFALADVQFPYPFSSNFELKWKPEIDSARTMMKGNRWNEAKEQLENAWEHAEEEISAYRTLRGLCRATSWHIVVNEIEACLNRIPANNGTIDHWRDLCALAHAMGVDGPSPSHHGSALESLYQGVWGNVFTIYTNDNEENGFKGGVKVSESISELTSLDEKRQALTNAIVAFKDSFASASKSRRSIGFHLARRT